MSNSEKIKSLPRTRKIPITIRKEITKTSPEEVKRTIIKCRYYAKQYYKDGGWCRINRQTFLMNPFGEKIQITDAFNIPYSPEYKMMGSIHAKLDFILYFPPIPKTWDIFNLIEDSDKAPFLIWDIERNDSGVYHVAIN